MKKIVLGISAGLSFVIFLILMFAAHRVGESQTSQMAARRWDADGGSAQISCFFSVNASVSADSILEFEHTIDDALTDAAVVQESENPGARLWADAFSADGKVTVSTERGSVEADAIGIGGDFFLLHPQKLLYGAYFSGNDLMQDYCIIDEDTAWQLFGSPDVAGMTVYISGVPHMVTGVVRRPEGRLEKAAGLDGTLVYVSYETLTQYGTSNGINHYEIVMPNPVSEFAYKFVKEGLGAQEKETEVVENSARYSFLSRLKLIPALGTRAMNGKAIIYPYWENVARGYEDILTVVTLFELLFLAYAVIMAVGLFVHWWRHKGWTLKEKQLILKDKAERFVEKQREKHPGKRSYSGEIADLDILDLEGDEPKQAAASPHGAEEEQVGKRQAE